MGSTVRAKDVTKDITSAITAVFGGELPHYTQLMQVLPLHFELNRFGKET